MNLLATLLFSIALHTTAPTAGSIYDFSFTTLEGKEVKMADFKGKKILIFNSASMCGYTPQLTDFEAIHKKYGEKLVIIGFPSNDFMQEHKEGAKIGEVCYGKYNVTFIMGDRVKVKGEGISPIFDWLTSQPNPDFTGPIKWNFEKFLIDENGKLVHRWRSNVSPASPEVTAQL